MGALLMAIALAASAASAAGSVSATAAATATVVHLEAAIQAAVRPSAPAQALATAVSDAIDFEELARRSLSAQWPSSSPSDRTRLLDLLRKIMQSNHLTRIRKAPAWRCEVVDARQQGQVVVVAIRATAADKSIAVNLHLLARGGRWRIHDAVIDGAGLVDAWAEQFARLLKKGGMPRLFEALETKARAGDGG